ncbi:hypothetical protein EHQ81_12095 [Leptospira selangorensis]|uniref:Lipoprotein n=1 Tax=Leptospira selangorensis TaxID=2484982 RepID=A0A5F2C1W7_9LEPT|nr:hypothetical protein [Leptospira selangorensis]TGM12988.1 hypothetical protein EHQ81_12095 [Leptospira selangorensis]TGM21260.1 hypothetical protein EHQ82_09650 [Leptospira selangorensis]
MKLTTLVLITIFISCRSTIGMGLFEPKPNPPYDNQSMKILEIEIEGDIGSRPLLVVNLTSDPFEKVDKAQRIDYYKELYIESKSIRLEIPAQAIYGKIEILNDTWYPLIFYNQSRLRLLLGVEKGILWSRYQTGYEKREVCLKESVASIYKCPALWEKGGVSKSIRINISEEKRINKLLTFISYLDTAIIYYWTGVPVPLFGFFATENEVEMTVE